MNVLNLILFIIENSETVLVTPLESMQEISDFIDLAPSNNTYEIHIDPTNLIEEKTPWDLNQYLNDYEQLKTS